MQWMIYGANGYTGELIARAAVKSGLSPILAGRNQQPIEALAKALGLSYRSFSLTEQDALEDHLSGLGLLLNCAGPFSATAKPLINACLKKGVHYLDITGEISVFEYAQQLAAKATEANVLLCPGVGFDVIPTDCIANRLKRLMPDATHLRLGFDSKSPLSPGTTKTAIEGMAQGGKVRHNGQLVTVPLAYKTQRIDFGNGEKLMMTIPWGDLSTAYYSTGIPNIEVYIPAREKQVSLLKSIYRMRWFFRLRWVQNRLKKKAAKMQGPNQAARQQLMTWVWGEAVNANGKREVARVKTANGYELTVTGSLAVVDYLMKKPGIVGYKTPAMLMGDDFITRLPGSSDILLEQ